MKKVLLSLAAALFALTASAEGRMQWGAKTGVNFSSYNVGLSDVSAKINLGTSTGFYVGAVNNYTFSKNYKWSVQSEFLFNIGGANVKMKEGLLPSLSGAGVDLSYITDGITIDETMKVSYNTYNIQIPVMVKYTTSDRLSIMAGPYINARLGGNVKLNSKMEEAFDNTIKNVDQAYLNHVLNMLPDGYIDLADSSTYREGVTNYLGDFANKMTRTVDFGMSIGLEYSFTKGFFFDARYNIGLLNLAHRTIDSDLLDYNYNELTNVDLGFDLSSRTQFIQLGIGYRF